MLIPDVMSYLTKACVRDAIPPYGLLLSESRGRGTKHARAAVCSQYYLDQIDKTRLMKKPHSLTTTHRKIKPECG